jgi:hypothetical protein
LGEWIYTRVYPKHSLRSNTKGYGGKTHYLVSQNGDTTTSSGRDLYYLQFSLKTVNPGTFGYALLAPIDGGEWSASRFSRFTPRERASGDHWIGGCVGPRAGLDAVVKKKIP